jgi:hypothetical protein
MKSFVRGSGKSSAVYRMLRRVSAQHNADSSLLIKLRTPLVRMKRPKCYAAPQAALKRSITRSHQ